MERVENSSTSESEDSSLDVCQLETSNESLVDAWIPIDQTYPLLTTRNGGNGILNPGFDIVTSPTILEVFKLISELEQEHRQCVDQGVYENLMGHLQELEEKLARREEERLELMETLEHRDTIIKALEKKIESKVDIIQNLQHKLRIVKTTVARSRKYGQHGPVKTPELKGVEYHVKAETKHTASKIEKLEKENASLKQDVATKLSMTAQLQKEAKAAQPLVNIGSAIRKRHIEHFLQQLREIGTLQDDKAPNQAVIGRGNCAAHWCDIRADLALVECKIFNQDKYGRLLQHIYGATVDRCVAMCNRGPWQFIKAWDMRIMYSASRDSGKGPDAVRFESLFDRMKSIPKNFAKSLEFGVSATFDGCSLAEEILEDMRVLTKKFMEQ
ncbi:uncharacterized protein BP5553_03642 [Venustampulla echinocandica]|uniref:Uncharacterized protein n=1 Tax=Venustampulla echinocandica TaxID=2656787 RepID=A0A370TUT7_9HELO|nr:uncharacterized protein BP5553_03642 [Venustampulla echinocandica]RDL39302.1 hypothetical protein BP5553_03642 [Venustampulla echinocandica]